MPEALIAVLATFIGVLIVAKSDLISREIIGFQGRAGRDLGGPYERLAVTPEDSHAHDRSTRTVRACVVLVGVAWIALAIIGFVVSA